MSVVIPRILIIEDDPQMRWFLETCLVEQGWKTMAAETARIGLAQARGYKPDLVILDLGLPDMEGSDVLGFLRRRFELPIIILSARNRESDITSALDSGADDYLTKPFNTSELLARIRAVLRRSAGGLASRQGESFRVGDLRVETALRKVYIGDREVHLTPIEYQLLTVLVKHAGLVVTHRQLLAEIWGGSHLDQIHYVRVYMGHLRHKLEANPARPFYILTEAGVGYRLRDSE
ncbi:MAG TPA: response regulator [Methylococcaceae bacterium]|jgi:two-component system KDP operon response regulator KdpE|nr:response regulator [Methylococcaceae bacterium]